LDKPTKIKTETKSIAIGSKENIGKVLKEYRETNKFALQNSNKNINLIGPIKVRATGPKTFSIVDNIDPIEIEMETVLTETKNRKREENKSLANHLAKFYSTTKRPSLHFEELEEPSLKFHKTPKRTEEITFRHSTTAIPALSSSSEKVNLYNSPKSELSKYKTSNHIKTDEESYKPYKTQVLPKSIEIGNVFREREPKFSRSFRFEDESKGSLKVRFVEVNAHEGQTNTRSKKVVFPEK